MRREEIEKKLICFGANGVNVLQGRHNGCIIQMRDYYAHRMNLVIETLSLYPLVSNILRGYWPLCIPISVVGPRDL
jgi:hypothetical protein